jgi:hypothetical protein
MMTASFTGGGNPLPDERDQETVIVAKISSCRNAFLSA